ncbi:hypothetical protein H4582DRAFT_2059177 [Lactarius indigo]|nr:hypothetical protein H4582DRAFT_2059177 [Lactarius indigo]
MTPGLTDTVKIYLISRPRLSNCRERGEELDSPGVLFEVPLAVAVVAGHEEDANGTTPVYKAVAYPSGRSCSSKPYDILGCLLTEYVAELLGVRVARAWHLADALMDEQRIQCGRCTVGASH